MTLSFADLQRRPSVRAEDLMATLREYATSGAAISGRVVRTLVMRTLLDADQMAHLIESAERGAESQRSRNFPRDAESYEDVADLLREMARPSMRASP